MKGENDHIRRSRSPLLRLSDTNTSIAQQKVENQISETANRD